MSTEQNTAAIKRWFLEGWQLEDPGPVVDEIFATNVVVSSPPWEAQGIEQVREDVRRMRSGISDPKFVVDDIIAVGDKVAYHLTMEWTHTGVFMGVAPTGKRVTSTSTGIARFAEGKIVEAQENHDAYGTLRQIGGV